MKIDVTGVRDQGEIRLIGLSAKPMLNHDIGFYWRKVLTVHLAGGRLPAALTRVSEP